MTNFKMPKGTKSVTVIRHYGDANTATTSFGLKVERQPYIFVDEKYGLVDCAPYDNHFIYEIKDGPKTKKMPSFMCTCGSYAVITGNKAYAHLGSSTRTGYLLVCYVHTTTNKHGDGSA